MGFLRAARAISMSLGMRMSLLTRRQSVGALGFRQGRR